MEHEYIRLKAIEWFNISGRGKVAVINMDDFPYGRKLSVGDLVNIDDKLYRCNGIELSSGLNGIPSKFQGILVKDIGE